MGNVELSLNRRPDNNYSSKYLAESSSFKINSKGQTPGNLDRQIFPKGKQIPRNLEASGIIFKETSGKNDYLEGWMGRSRVKCILAKWSCAAGWRSVDYNRGNCGQASSLNRVEQQRLFRRCLHGN